VFVHGRYDAMIMTAWNYPASLSFEIMGDIQPQDDCIFLPTKQRHSHELRELRENNEETTYFAKEATARNTRTRKQQIGRPSLLSSRNLLFLRCLPVFNRWFRAIRAIRGYPL